MNCIYDEVSGRYVINKSARILFPNFTGAEQDYNQAGKRNFKLIIDEDLANELRERGVSVSVRPPRDETESEQYSVKIGVYKDADVYFLSGRTKTLLEYDDLELVDKEFRRGHVRNGEIGIEFHVSINTRVRNASPYLRLDTMVIPVGKSRLLEEYEEFDEEE